MGAFFANIHVQSRDGQEIETHASLLSKIRELAKGKGLTEASDDGDASQIVIVGPPGQWIAVYDSATEADPSELAALTRTLSRTTDWRALAALVHDSSKLFLFLYEAGKRLDEVGDKKKGHAEKWMGFVSAERIPALGKAFRREDLFAEHTLLTIGALVGIDEESIATGCTYLRKYGTTPSGATTLLFRPDEIPAHERPAAGPSRFVATAFDAAHLLSRGGRMSLSASVHNDGGASRGLSFIVHGPAIEAGLVEPESATLSNQQRRTEPRPFERKTLKSGREGFVAEFPEFEIPAAIGRLFTAPEGVSPGEWIGQLQRQGIDLSRNQQRCFVSDVYGFVDGRVLAVGKAAIYLSFVPLEAREGQFHHGQEISVIEPPRAPLRAEVDHPESLANLETPHVLVALATSTLDVPEAAQLAAEAIERWGLAWSDAELTSAIFFGREGGAPRKPKTSTLAVQNFPASAAWRNLREAMVYGRAVRAHSSGRRGPERLFHGDGFDFGRGLTTEGPPGDVDLPTLRLAVDIRGRPDAEALLQMARSVVEDFVVRARCAQAFVARWGAGGSLDTTPYEQVCRVSGQCTLRLSWQTRFLRAVSMDGMWLGETLLDRLDRAEVERVALTEGVGQTLRLVPREGISIDEVERVLAPILPSARDHHEGVNWIHGRRDAPPG
jgi:hypothetical protein